MGMKLHNCLQVKTKFSTRSLRSFPVRVMGRSLITMLCELTVMVLLVNKVMSEAELIQDTQACCGTTATFRCIVTESTTLTWNGSFPLVEFFSNSPINTPVRRGDNDEFEFILENVQRNPNNPTLFSDFNSTLTVDVGLDDMMEGIQIQCYDLRTTAAENLTLETTQEAIDDDGMCNCTEGGGNVTVMWSVPELCGWENVVPTVSLICLTCEDTQPTALDLSLPELRSSQQISFIVELATDNNYTIEISATNACGDTTMRSCEAVCSMASNLSDECKIGDLTCARAGITISICVGGSLALIVFTLLGVIVFKKCKKKTSMMAVGIIDREGKVEKKGAKEEKEEDEKEEEGEIKKQAVEKEEQT